MRYYKLSVIFSALAGLALFFSFCFILKSNIPFFMLLSMLAIVFICFASYFIDKLNLPWIIAFTFMISVTEVSELITPAVYTMMDMGGYPALIFWSTIVFFLGIFYFASCKIGEKLASR